MRIGVYTTAKIHTKVFWVTISVVWCISLQLQLHPAGGGSRFLHKMEMNHTTWSKTMIWEPGVDAGGAGS